MLVGGRRLQGEDGAGGYRVGDAGEGGGVENRRRIDAQLWCIAEGDRVGGADAGVRRLQELADAGAEMEGVVGALEKLDAAALEGAELLRRKGMALALRRAGKIGAEPIARAEEAGAGIGAE